MVSEIPEFNLLAENMQIDADMSLSLSDDQKTSVR